MSLRRVAVAASVALAVVASGAGAGTAASAAERPGAALSAAVAAATADPPKVLSVQQLPADRRPPGAGIASRITYTSTTVGGEPTVVSGLVFAPSTKAPTGGWPVVSWAHGTTGLGDSCAPSANPLSADIKDYLGTWLQQGYAVVATDYAGLGGPGVHPYLDGAVAAQGTIDIVRAMRRLAPGLFAKRWAVIGHSQGGHAALFTGHLATRVAPELDFRGTVALAPPSNLTEIFARFTPQTTILAGLTGLVSYIFAGVQVSNPGFDMGPYLSPLGRDVVTDAQTLCGSAQAERVKGLTIGQLLAKPLDDAYAKAMGPVFDVPTTGYDRPLLVAQGAADKTVPPFLTRRLANDLQAAGQPLTYKTYESVDHSGVRAASLADVTAFLREAFAAP
ncbi:alpha/beta fold hydrolase [Streptomyces sp. B1866]|uniref:alpha/beta hydrolase family protein n=1 Tax=Streptomyces sp. B1866 TaxID=3075431 RepID=UPI00288EC2F8|nr:lipase family protein [Streptomyces sp. B1866]MDT3397336.1 alpha/beta fold hydrolase [Streptomyces sp. B1866]